MSVGGKVVKLEEVAGRPSIERVKFKEETFVFSEDGGRTSKLHYGFVTPGSRSYSVTPVSRLQESLQPTAVSQQSEKAVVGPLQVTGTLQLENDQEDEDMVGPLPKDWPMVPALLRRRSCELTNTMSPCVNKAVSHLDLVQTIIEDWFRQAGEDPHSGLSTPYSRPSTAKVTPIKQSMKFEGQSGGEPGMDTPTKIGYPSTCSRSTLASIQTDLSIQDIGARADHDEMEDIVGPVDDYPVDLPYLGAEDVIEEVMTLLARLDHDRQETLAKLKKEKYRVNTLNTRIETLAMRRLNELPSLVQQEHEACILDVNELQWHVAYSSRSEDRIQNKTNIAEVLNQRLKEDIAFVEKHIPLVQEKLELELEAMDKIRKAQLETNKELEMTLTRQAKTESKSQEANQKAMVERAYIRKELDTVRDKLSKISEELAYAKRTFNTYTHHVNDIRQQLKDNEQEIKVLQVKDENAKYAEEMQALKVRDLETTITEAEFEHRRLANQNLQLQQDLDLKRNSNFQRIAELRRQLRHKENDLRQISLKNKETVMEIQDAQDKIADCARQKVKDEKNVQRINKEIGKTDQQMDVTMEEFRKVFAINSAIRGQLTSQEEKAFKLEENLKQTADTLKRQVKDEVHSRTVLQARINSDSTEVGRSTVETTVKKEKVNKVAEEVETAIVQVEEKVNRLRSTQQAKARKIQELETKIKEIQEKHKTTEETMTERIKTIEPHHHHLKENVLFYDKKLDHMDWRTEMMTKNMDDMDSSSVMMTRVWESTQKHCQALDEELEELNIQLETEQKLENNLKVTLQSIVARIRAMNIKHEKFTTERQACSVTQDKDKYESLKENRKLASQYRQLQNKYVILKDELLNSYEDRIKLENSIKDLKQLHSLQKRMHGALVEYFKFRGLYNEAELDKLSAQSDNNGYKVMELQGHMNASLRSITDFLQNQVETNSAASSCATKPKVLPPVMSVKV